jgi:hypothetical protein
LNDVEYQFDAPSSDGQTRLPSRVGSMFGTTIGRPSAVRPLAQVTFFAYCFPKRNVPVVRSSTYMNPLRLTCTRSLRG